MKRNKHILINLTDEQYNAIQFIAYKENRKLSDATYLLLIEILNSKIIKYVDEGGSNLKPLKYNNNDIDIVFIK